MSDTFRDAIFHLAEAAEWEAALHVGEYRRSTLELTLEEEGFIHASFADQVQATADRYYRGRHDIVLLRIDPTAVPAPIRVEDLSGRGVSFPHIYGPLPTDAVAAAVPVPCGIDGRLDVASSLEGERP